MGNLCNNSISIIDAMKNIKNGKYIMPAFQRQYVWETKQIEKLWDSILLDYPIATFLFWHIDSSNSHNGFRNVYFCDFLSEISFNYLGSPCNANYGLKTIDTSVTDTAILDGQQRLTSLFASLFGKTSARAKNARKKSGNKSITGILIELDKNKVEEDEEYNSKKHGIKLSEKYFGPTATQFQLKKITDYKFQKNDENRKSAIEEAIANVPDSSKQYARNLLNKLCQKIFDETLIHYSEISDMGQDDALEMFVRFNSGGKSLQKYEITLSILEAYWPRAKEEIGKILVGDYEDFKADFIIRTSHMLYGNVVNSTINKGVAQNLEKNFEKLEKTLKNLKNILEKINVNVSRFSSSWNVLIPIIYFIYYHDDYMKSIEGIRAYLYRAILFTFFQSGTTGKLQRMKTHLSEYNVNFSVAGLDQLPELEVTAGKIEDILNAEKGSRIAGEALYFLSLDWWNPVHKYEQDHLHSKSKFDHIKPATVSDEEWLHWRTLRNRLPNLQLLEGRSNGSKQDMDLLEYYKQMNSTQKETFLKQAIIPEDTSLEIHEFGDFYEKRKILLCERLKKLLE